MDGFQRKIRQSLQYRISIWLAVCIIAVTLSGVLLSFLLAFHEANEFQDDQLRQVAALIDYHHLPLLPSDGESVLKGDDDTRVVVQMLGQKGLPLLSLDEQPLLLSPDIPDGIQTVVVNNIEWRVYVKAVAPEIRIAVSQPTWVRNDIAADSAWRTLVPLLLLLPLLIILVGIVTKKMFKPVRAMAQELDARSEQELGRLDETKLPLEIKPFISAINRLLLRAEQSISTQRRFIADAAHELRSPMTALSLQAERLSAADMSPTAKDRVITLRQGIARTQSLLAQMLALARVQENVCDEQKLVSLQLVIRSAIEDLILHAEQKHIDLGMADCEDIEIFSGQIDLKMMVKNLIANAIQYTPSGGRVDVSIQVQDTTAILKISDTGPGIRQEDRQRVFEAFYRVLGNEGEGSGLGLSIVKTVADRIGCEIELNDTNPFPPYGLTVKIKFRRFTGRPVYASRYIASADQTS